MSEPESNLSAESRALVEAGRGAMRPSAADRLRVREALRARLPGTPLTDVSSGARAASNFGWPALIGAIVGVAALGGLALVALRSEPATPAPAPAPAASVVAPVTPPLEPAPTAPPVIDAAPPPSPLPSQANVVRRSSDRLAEEVEILSRAEKELHAGRNASALRILDEHQRRFARGKLAQERIAAQTRALCALGRFTEAEAGLARLAPGSLHASRAREACARYMKK